MDFRTLEPWACTGTLPHIPRGRTQRSTQFLSDHCLDPLIFIIPLGTFLTSGHVFLLFAPFWGFLFLLCHLSVREENFRGLFWVCSPRGLPTPPSFIFPLVNLVVAYGKIVRILKVLFEVQRQTCPI